MSDQIFDALVLIARTVLHVRGEWHGPATAHADIDAAVNGAADLIRGDDMPDLVPLGLIFQAIGELKGRAGR